MQDLIAILEQPYNWLYSFFIFVALGTWLVSLLGLFDLGGDHDFGHEGAHGPDGGGFLHGLGHVLGFGAIPTSISATLLLFLQGVAGIGLNEWVMGALEPTGWARYLALGGTFLGSLGVASLGLRLANRPLGYLFRDYGAVVKADALVGKVAKVSSGKVDQLSGQATLRLDDGTDIMVAVRTVEPGEALAYGEKLLLLDFDQEKNVYLAERYD
jgi:hypothetical protein